MSPITSADSAVAGGLGAMVAICSIWGVEHFSGIDIPSYVELAVTGIISTVVSWITPDRGYVYDPARYEREQAAKADAANKV